MRFLRAISIALAFAVLWCGALAPVAFAAGPVEALGLFKDRALLRIHGIERYLKSGETSPEGARLVSSTAEAAVVTFQGETYRLTLSDAVGGTFATPTRTVVSIAPDDSGQYRVDGTVNGRPVGFLVDTGASVIAMSEVHARDLGVDFESSFDRTQVATAQGQVNAYLVSLDEVVVGGIAARRVRAAVIPGSFPAEVLLGMSFLRTVSIQETAGVLQLTQKY